jgi:hypothetical protein
MEKSRDVFGGGALGKYPRKTQWIHNTGSVQSTDGRGNCGGFHRCTALIITTRDKLFF